MASNDPTAMSDGALVSVNVGQPGSILWHGREVVTSIWKAPVAGRVRVDGINVSGDRQADLRVHGGPDKAVYAYATEDYRWWEAELDTALQPGTFGENLTVTGLNLRAAIVGEVWRVGTTTLQVTQPRLPCFKLGLKMGDASFIDRFAGAARYGVYLRILTPGDLGAGDPITVTSRPDRGVPAAFIGDTHTHPDHEALQRLTDTPGIPENWRDWATRQLARTSRNGG